MQPSAATEIIHSSLFNIHYSFCKVQRNAPFIKPSLLFQGEGKIFQNGQTEPVGDNPKLYEIQREVGSRCIDILYRFQDDFPESALLKYS
jgi:hypothetical protein